MKVNRLNSKGSMAWLWATIMVVLFIFGLIYLTLDNIIKNKFVGIATDLGTPLPAFIIIAWDILPFFLVMGLFILAITKSQREHG